MTKQSNDSPALAPQNKCRHCSEEIYCNSNGEYQHVSSGIRCKANVATPSPALAEPAAPSDTENYGKSLAEELGMLPELSSGYYRKMWDKMVVLYAELCKLRASAPSKGMDSGAPSSALSAPRTIAARSRDYLIPICDECIKLNGEMCHEPTCAFCRRTMQEVGEYLDVLLIRPIIDGERTSETLRFTKEQWLAVAGAESGVPLEKK